MKVYPPRDIRPFVMYCVNEGYVHVKEILSHLLADAEAGSLVSDSFLKMHIINKINVSVKAICRVAAKKLYVM